MTEQKLQIVISKYKCNENKTTWINNSRKKQKRQNVDET